MCGWPGKAWPKSFKNRLARPDVRLRLGQEFGIVQGVSNGSDTLGEVRREIFNVHQVMPADETSSLTSIRGRVCTLLNHHACETLG